MFMFGRERMRGLLTEGELSYREGVHGFFVRVMVFILVFFLLFFFPRCFLC